ncbi:MAG: redoxin family protein [Planctomycetaceae bacterium]
MRNLMIVTVLSGLWCGATGCSEGEAPSPAVGEKTTGEPGVVAVAPTSEADSNAAPHMDLVETTPADAPGPAGEQAPAGETSPTADLMIGDAAPPISIAKWVQGDPVDAFASDKVYVVEFWATWCGPCLASMPHIASLQTEYGDKVKFIGVSAEEEEVVSEFMAQESRGGKVWSEVLTYTIALDEERKTNTAYMEAAGQNGIPCAFIVGKSGKVEWIGHPAAIDEPLQQVVDGTWDLTKARTTFLAEHEAEEMMQEIGPKINAALQKGDFKTGVALIEQLIEKFPENDQFKQARFQFLLKGEMFDEANKAAEALIKESNDNALELNQLAWIMATGVAGPGPDLDLALSAAKRAEELTESKDASILDTVSRVLFKKGNIEDAIANQKKAIEIASPGDTEQFEASLKEFEAALKGDDPEAKPADTDEAKPADDGEAKPAETDAAKPADDADAKPAESDAAAPVEGDAAKPADDAAN